MELKMFRRFCLLTVCIFILALFFSVTPRHCYGIEYIEITIDVAPNVLNLQNQGEVVTVHTDIGYGEVSASAVYLNGVLISSWKADNRGYFVAKFVMNDIKEQVVVGDNIFTLVGTTTGGIPFSGSQVINVVDNIPVGGK